MAFAVGCQVLARDSLVVWRELSKRSFDSSEKHSPFVRPTHRERSLTALRLY